MFEITENASGKFVEFSLTGKLTKEAYDAFVPMMEEHFAYADKAEAFSWVSSGFPADDVGIRKC